MHAPGGCLLWGGRGACSGGVGVPALGGRVPALGGLLPAGLFWGVPGPGGLLPGGWSAPWVPVGDPPGQLMLQAVRILLECILVQKKVLQGSHV